MDGSEGVKAVLRSGATSNGERERVWRNKVCAARVIDAEGRSDAVAADHAEDCSTGSEIAAQAGVAAQNEAGQSAELRILPATMQIDWHRSQRAMVAVAAECAFYAQRAARARCYVSTDGFRLNAKMPLVLGRLPEGEVCVDQRYRSLLLIELEIHTRVGGLDIRKARSWPGVRLRGRRGRNARGLQQQALKVPAAVRSMHQVDAGIGEGDGRKLNAVPPQ